MRLIVVGRPLDVLVYAFHLTWLSDLGEQSPLHMHIHARVSFYHIMHPSSVCRCLPLVDACEAVICPSPLLHK